MKSTESEEVLGGFCFVFKLRKLCLYGSHENALSVFDCSEYKWPTALAAALWHPSQQVSWSCTSHGLPQPTSDHSKITKMCLILGCPGLWLEDSPTTLPSPHRNAQQPMTLPPNASSFPLSFTWGQIRIEFDIPQLPPTPSSGSLKGISPSPLHIKSLASQGTQMNSLGSIQKVSARVSFSNCLTHKYYKWSSYLAEHFQFFLLFSKCDHPLHFHM